MSSSSSHLPTTEGAVSVARENETSGEGLPAFDELLVMVTMPVVGLSVCPGFFLCVPALALLILPLVALGVLAVAIGALVAAVAVPLLAGRAAIRLMTSR